MDHDPFAREGNVSFDTHRDFVLALKGAFLNAMRALITGRSNRLLSWRQVEDELHLGSPVRRSIGPVPVERIVGSVDRYQDFDRAFLPMGWNIEDRWRSIAKAYYAGVGLPPVQLYKVGEAYFVLDGHHRISVAKRMGAIEIDAQVTEVESRVPVTARLDADYLVIAGEYTRFLEQTRLDQLRPQQRIEFTIGGGYGRLHEHIAVHRHLMGLERGLGVAEDEAVCDWYDNLYTPLVQAIRDKHLLAAFPHRNEADLYLWIMDHQHYLREVCDSEISVEQATDAFAERYPEQPVVRAVRAVEALVNGPDCPLPAPDESWGDEDEGVR